MNNSVAIIGAGPSGLVSAKAAVEFGMRPTVFEGQSGAGGLWRPTAGAVWPNMSTNISRYNCVFSDFPWQDGTPEFPKQPDVYKYLERYTTEFALGRFLRPACIVNQLSYTQFGWSIEWTENNSQRCRSEIFDSVIIASGYFTRPAIPKLGGSHDYKGREVHSSQYLHPDAFCGQRVTVIGFAFSGVEIATELARHGIEVTVTISRPMWIIPRYLPSTVGKRDLPLDLLFYTRSSAQRSQSMVKTEENRRKNRYFHQIGANPGFLDRRFWIDPEGDTPPYVIVSDDFSNCVRSGKLGLQLGRAVRLEPRDVLLEDGTRIPTDVIIWSTGYELELSFFSPKQLALLSFDPSDKFQPVLLHKCTFHPHLPNLAFVGIYRGPFFGIIELQARWACSVLSGYQSAPARDAMAAGLDSELQLRLMQPRPQFPHGDYVNFADSLASEFGCLPDLNPSGEYYDSLWNGPVIPAHYRLSGPGGNRIVALREIESVMKRTQG